jgi:hypothetical protein
MRRLAVLALMAGLFLGLFAGPAFASSISCDEPSEVVERAMQSSSTTFFTGKAIAVTEDTETHRPDGLRAFMVGFEVRRVWNGPTLSDFQAFEYMLVGEDPIMVGRSYHVVLEEDGAANQCGVFDAAAFPTLTEGLKAQQVFTSFLAFQDEDAEEVLAEGLSDDAEPEWWAWSIGAAVVLAIASFVAVGAARRRP